MLEVLIYIVLFFTGFIGGFIDSVAGGGGLITLPVLVSIGLPPHVALGTNKFQSSFGSFSSALNFIRKGVVDLKTSGLGILFTFIGAFIGTTTIQLINADFLGKIIPGLLTLIFIYVILSPNLGKIDRHPRMRQNLFFILFGLLLGFYDGFFGPGTGNFWVVSIMFILGFNMIKATGYTKVMNFTSNLTALTLFLIGGNINFYYGIIMAIGQFIGARAGSSLAIRKGSGFIRPIFLFMVGAVIVSLIYKNYF
ncbi:MAG: TSUP family transporter [Candidatus Delongbacteria bacterium]|nr:TSUP family transporter [Candidatus Delongbacteria bacterium]MBN2834652.1 TSUP family transporter [Candidatus Delongbacteria bacterium]